MGAGQHRSLGSHGRNIPWAVDRFEPVDEDLYTRSLSRHRRPDEPQHGAGDDRSDAGHSLIHNPGLLLSYRVQPMTFYLSATAFALFIAALLVTVFVEVPTVQEIVTWTVPTLPGNWQQLRDRWSKFHVVRVIAGFLSLILLVAAAIF
jgi:hypothetical protein